jgi:argininosuccinate lyase
MMPNKKNPDPAELVRGRAARVIGSLTGMLAMLKGLPLAYQRDLQEDKPPLFEAAATLESSLGVMAGMISTLAVDRERMRAAAGEGYITATAVADALVRRGVAFRAAHRVVGTLVAEAERGGIGLEALDDATIAAALAASDDSIAVTIMGDAALPGELRAAAGLEGALASCDVVGGTAPRRVAAALAAARARLGV